MATPGIYLQHSSVNSGTAVWLKGASFTYGMKKLVNYNPEVATYTPANVDVYGIENPAITVKGNIDLEDTSSNEVSESLLKDFWRLESDTAITLTIGLGGTGAADATAFTKYDGSGTDIPVRIKNITFTSEASSQRGHIISYDLTLLEDA